MCVWCPDCIAVHRMSLHIRVHAFLVSVRTVYNNMHMLSRLGDSVLGDFIFTGRANKEIEQL